MAKRLNKNVVVGLTLAGMVVTTAAAFLMVINLPKKDPQPLVEDAKAAAERGEYEDAMQYYRKAWSRARTGGRSQAEANSYLVQAGEMALKAGQAHRALEFWSTAILNDPQYEEAQEKLVEFYLENAILRGGVDWTRVQAEAEKLCRINESSFLGLHALGVALVQQRAVDEGNVEKGKEKLRQAVEGDKSNPEYARSLAQVYFSEGETAEAANVYGVLIDVLSKEPAQDAQALATAFRYRGEFYTGTKNVLERRLRQQRPQANPVELAAAMVEVATREKVQLRNLGEEARRDLCERAVREFDERGLRDLTEAVNRAPQDVEALIALGEYWQLKRSTAEDEAARQAEMDGFRAKAREHYEKAIRLEPEGYSGYLRLALLYRSEGKPEDALKVLEARMARGYERGRYLGWRDRMYMAQLREQAFRTHLAAAYALPARTGDQAEYDRELERIVGELESLYNKSVVEAVRGESEPGVLFMKGRLLRLQGDLQGAIRVLEQADKALGGVFPELKRLLADLYLRTGVPGAARDALLAVLRVSPNDEAALTMLASVHAQLCSPEHPEEAEKAIDVAQRALEINPKNPDALRAMLRAYMFQKNYVGVRKIQQLLQQEADPIRDKLSRAAVLLVQSDTEPERAVEAEQLLREVLKADPVNLQALRVLVTILTRRAQNAADRDQKVKQAAEITNLLDEAQAAAEKQAAEGAPSTQPSQGPETSLKTALAAIERLRVLADVETSDEQKLQRQEKLIQQGDDPYAVAMELFQLYREWPGRTDDALEQLKTAQNLAPENADLIDVLFRYALARQDWKLAEECVDKAVAAGLDRSGGHFYRGRLLLARAEQQEQVAEAERELRAGLAEFPNYRNAHVWLGEALMKMRQFDSARRALREALRLNPSNGSAAVGLAMVAHQSGDDAEKDKYLAMAAKLVPTHPWVREQLMLLAEEKDPKTTIERRQAHRKNKPEDLDNLLTLAELYVKVGEQEKAREVFGECRRLRPDDVIVAQHYARFLRSRQPPELEAAEEMLRKLAEAIDPKEGTKKAAAQLLLAGHLRTVAEEGGRETPREKWDQVDAAHEAAAALSDVAEVRLDIGNYFLQTRRYKKVEEWARKAIAAIEKNGRPEHHQRGPRRMLIDAMIRTRDSRRREEIEREIEAYRALFPDDPSASVMLGQLYAAIGPDRQAFEQFTDYIQKAPQEAAGYFRRGLLYLRRSRWDEAIKDLREVKRVDPSFADYEARLLLAQALENSGQTDAAITELRSVLEEDSSLLSVVRNLLTIYARLERWDAAESLIAPRAEAEPDNPVWPRLRAELASERGRPGPAVTFAREAVEKSEFDPDVVDFFLVTCLKHERYDELIAFVNDQLKPEQRNALVQLRLGGAYAAKEDTVRAIECYARSLEAEDARLDTFMDVIWDGVRRLDPDAVREAASKRLESQPQERASKLILLMVHRRKGDRDAFIRSLKEVAEAVPADTPKDKWEKILLMRELALAMHGSEHAQEARDTYNKILELHPNDPVALNNLAYLLMNELQDPKSARRYAERALEGAPENAGVLDTLGWNLVLLGEYDEAIRKLRHALEIQSELDALHYHLAEALFRRSGTAGANQKGDLNEAEAECRRAHELIMKTGRDPEGILDDVVALGEKLGLSLEKNLPAAGQTP